MAELTINIPYKPLSKFLLTVLGILWLCIGMMAISWFYAQPEQTLIVRLIFTFLGGILFAYPPFAVISFYREGGTLIADSDGVVLPASLYGLGPSTSIKWKDVKMVDIHQTARGKDSLLLRSTASGELPTTIEIKMSCIPQDQMEKFLLAMEIWLPKETWTERAKARRDGMLVGQNETGFTQMWESELRRRYNATTFVPHDPDSKIGDDFTILKQLAFGGFSAVYLAQNRNLEKVVIKELVVQNSDPEVQSKAVELFNREAQLLAKIQHDRIARVFDHFVKDGNTYMVMEHIEGETLRNLVRRKGAQPESWVRDCAIQLASILDHLHTMQPAIIHRDFTPDNLLLNHVNEITLIDFGAANEFTTAATGTLIGKQAYMPIEQIRGKAEPRSDLYALGCVLHYLCTGVEPEPLSICHPKTLNSSISDELDALIARLTATEASERFASAHDLLACLNEDFQVISIKVDSYDIHR